MAECGDEKLGDFGGFFFFHAAGGHGGRAEANAGGVHGLAGVVRDHVFVQRETDFVEHGFGFVPVVPKEVNASMSSK